ncbi:MAG: hypothetical protein IPM16_22370 [Chloroflexi bacterium]|nr:hypothetical protein [Chloroflexota bacterium]
MTNPTIHTHSENGDAHRNERKQQWSANFGQGGHSLFEVRLPNGRTFSIGIGHLILFGLLLWWLPSNWVVLAILLSIACQYGLFSASRTTDEKPKRKNDEALPNDDIVEF